jgi:hypothetical protein
MPAIYAREGEAPTPGYLSLKYNIQAVKDDPVSLASEAAIGVSVKMKQDNENPTLASRIHLIAPVSFSVWSQKTAC